MNHSCYVPILKKRRVGDLTIVTIVNLFISVAVAVKGVFYVSHLHLFLSQASSSSGSFLCEI